MEQLAYRRWEQQGERYDGGERGKTLSDGRVKATGSVLEEIPPSNSERFEYIPSRPPPHDIDLFVPSRCRRLPTRCVGQSRVREVENNRRSSSRDPSPKFGAFSSRRFAHPILSHRSGAITLTHRLRSRLRPRPLSRMLSDVSFNVGSLSQILTSPSS